MKKFFFAAVIAMAVSSSFAANASSIILTMNSEKSLADPAKAADGPLFGLKLSDPGMTADGPLFGLTLSDPGKTADGPLFGLKLSDPAKTADGPLFGLKLSDPGKTADGPRFGLALSDPAKAAPISTQELENNGSSKNLPPMGVVQTPPFKNVGMPV